MMLAACLLALLPFTVVPQAPPNGGSQEDPAAGEIPVEKWPPEVDLEGMRPGTNLLHLVSQRPLPRSPLRSLPGNPFHGLLGPLPLDSAEPIEDSRVDLTLGHTISSGKLDISTPAYFVHYDALLVETFLDLRAGIHDDWEFGIRLNMSELLERDGKVVLIREGVPLIAEGHRDRGPGDARLFAKHHLLSVGEDALLSVMAGAKIPLADGEDLLSSGSVDLMARLLYTQDIGPATLHLNIGGIFPYDVELFEDRVRVRPVLESGAALAYELAPWAHASLQLQGHQSVFTSSGDSIQVLDKPALTLHGGTRLRLGSYFLEAGVGTGLNDQSSDWILSVAFTVPLG